MAIVQILTAAIPDPTAQFQDQLEGAIRGVHIHLDDPSVCITQAQIICVYSGKLGQRSPRRCRKRPPHVDFKAAAAEWKQVCLVQSRAQGGPGWMEEGGRDPCRPVCVWWKKKGSACTTVCATTQSMKGQLWCGHGQILCHAVTLLQRTGESTWHVYPLVVLW